MSGKAPIGRHRRARRRHSAAPRGPMRMLGRGIGPRRLSAMAIAAVVLFCVPSVWHTAYAAFYKTTPTGSNSWTTGTVTFGANTPASAMFTVSGAQPGSTGTGCVQLSYTGSIAASVRLYLKAADLTGTLGPYLVLQVNEDSNAAHTCASFSSTATPYNATGMSDTTKTMSTFSAASGDYATGVSSWNATQNATRLYQFVWQLKDDNAAAGRTAGVTFTWEAQSS